MNTRDQQAMHNVAVRLMQLTEGTGWEAMRYAAIARTVEELTTFCAVCDCQAQRNALTIEHSEPRHESDPPGIIGWLNRDHFTHIPT